MAKAQKSASTETALQGNETAPEKKGGVQILKKISNALFKEIPNGSRIPVAGVVRGVETKASNLGEYDKFTGDFVTKVGDTLHRASVGYFPAILSGVLKNAFLSARDKLTEAQIAAGHDASVEFSVFLVKKADEKSNTGYVWALETKDEPKPEQDKVLALLG